MFVVLFLISELQSCWLVLPLQFLRRENSLRADDPGHQALDRAETWGVPDQAGVVEDGVLGVLVLANCPGRHVDRLDKRLGQNKRLGEMGESGERLGVSLTSPSLHHLHHLLRSLHLDLIELLHEGVPGRGHLGGVVHHDGQDDLGSCRDVRAEGEVVSLGEVALGSSGVGQADVVTLRGSPVHRALNLRARDSGHLLAVASLGVLNIEDLYRGGGDERKEERENNGLNIRGRVYQIVKTMEKIREYLHVVRSSTVPPKLLSGFHITRQGKSPALR